MNYKKIFDYDNFQKYKLEYIIIILLIFIFGCIIYTYFKNKYNHKHHESFQNEALVDVLLGEDRKTLSDVIDSDNQLQITYYDNTNNEPLVFYKAINQDETDKSFKYLGDLVESIDINNFNINYFKSSDIKNNSIHLLNPIINSTDNSVTLTHDNDVKSNIININSSNKNTGSYYLFNYLGFIDNNDDDKLDIDMKRINKFFNDDTNKYTINEFEKKNCDNYNSDNLFNEITKLSENDNKKTLIKYKKYLDNINKSFSDKFKNKFDDLINSKKDELGDNITIIPCGYKFIDSNDKSIDFPLIKYDTLKKKNDFYKNTVPTITDPETKNIFIRNSYITVEPITINNENFDYAFLIINDNSFKLGDELNNDTVKNVYSTKFENILLKLTTYLTKITSITNISSIDNLDMPLQIIRTKIYDEESEDTHMTFGDIIDTTYKPKLNNNNYESLLNNYVKVPIRCCRQIYPVKKYSDLKPIKILNKQQTIYQIYKHPLYNTFRVFIEGNFNDQTEKEKPLYEIIPCAGKVTRFKDKTEKYKSLKDKCIQNENKKLIPLAKKSFSELQLSSTKNEINKNENTLNKLRESLNDLQKEVDRKNIIKTEYNRVKLQTYNDEKSVLINRLNNKLSNNNMDINVFYTEKIIQYLIDQCKSGDLVFCKKNKKLLDKLENLKDEDEDMKKDKLIEIIQQCPDMDGMISKEELNKCYQCEFND